MSLKSDLKKLKAEKADALQNLHYTYLHTKRDVARAANPGRFVRKHLGVALGAAALTGLFIAPRPSPRYTKKDIEEAAKAARKDATAERSDSVLGHVAQLVKNALGQLERAIPAPKPPADGHAAAPASVHFDAKTGKPVKSSGMLGTILALVLSRIDLAKILPHITQLVMHYVQGSKSPAAAHNGKHSEPNVSVADAGTVKPHDYENFQ